MRQTPRPMHCLYRYVDVNRVYQRGRAPASLASFHARRDTQVIVSLWVNALWGGLCLIGFVILRGWLKGPGGPFQRRAVRRSAVTAPPCSSPRTRGAASCFREACGLRRSPAVPQELQDLFLRPPRLVVGKINQICEPGSWVDS